MRIAIPATTTSKCDPGGSASTQEEERSMYHGLSRRIAAVTGGALLATSLFSTAAGAALAQSPAGPACDSLNMLYATVEADVDAIKVGIPLYEQATGTKINLDSQPYNALQQK